MFYVFKLQKHGLHLCQKKKNNHKPLKLKKKKINYKKTVKNVQCLSELELGSCRDGEKAFIVQKKAM